MTSQLMDSIQGKKEYILTNGTNECTFTRCSFGTPSMTYQANLVEPLLVFCRDLLYSYYTHATQD